MFDASQLMGQNDLLDGQSKTGKWKQRTVITPDKFLQLIKLLTWNFKNVTPLSISIFG